MCQIMLTILDAILTALHLTPEQCQAEVRLAAAMKVFEPGRLSSGAAAELAGVPKPVFLEKLADYQIETFERTGHDLGLEIRLG